MFKKYMYVSLKISIQLVKREKNIRRITISAVVLDDSAGLL